MLNLIVLFEHIIINSGYIFDCWDICEEGGLDTRATQEICGGSGTVGTGESCSFSYSGAYGCPLPHSSQRR